MQVKKLFPISKWPTAQDTEICISSGETSIYLNIFEHMDRDSSSWPLMAKPIIIHIQVNFSHAFP